MTKRAEDHTKIRRILVAAALAIAFLGRADLAVQNPQGSGPKTQKPAQAPRGEIWKSETTGKLFRVRIEKNIFHSDCVSLDPELTRKGAHIRARLSHVGSKWRGTSDIYLPCAVGESATAAISNWCRMTMGMEVDSMTADRITGQIEDPKRGAFDCQHCKVTQTVWKPFVWVRKR